MSECVVPEDEPGMLDMSPFVELNPSGSSVDGEELLLDVVSDAEPVVEDFCVGLSAGAKTHSFPRALHFEQGIWRSHFILDSVQATHDFRRVVSWLKGRALASVRTTRKETHSELHRFLCLANRSLRVNWELQVCQAGKI